MSEGGMRPFQVAVGDDVLDDLAALLRRVRWPDEIPGSSGTWEYGTDLGYLQELVAYWLDGFDWRAQEKAINEFPQFVAPVDDIDVHFLQVEGNGPAPLPLLLCHGWPSSFWEFSRLIPRLTDPARFGGDRAQPVRWAGEPSVAYATSTAIRSSGTSTPSLAAAPRCRSRRSPGRRTPGSAVRARSSDSIRSA